MRAQQIMFMGLILAAGTLISLTFAGAWFSDADVDIANSFTVWKQVNILGLWSVNTINLDFFIGGAKSLMMMDFAFFVGAGQLFQWFMFFTFGLALLWGIFTVIISVAQGFLHR
ncbi:MAG: hypothetical protein PHI12_12335 [Dehalococcoidales bacterium]|nr:hypothetical protein [Dehalococcoidales bacterium]